MSLRGGGLSAIHGPLPCSTTATLERVVLGSSVQGRDIEAYIHPCKDYPVILVLGGVHGDEPKSVFVTQRLLATLRDDGAAGWGVAWVVVPVVNPDGYERRKRPNAHGVDLNRNFPTRNWQPTSKRSRMYGGSAPASEPETRAVMAAVERFCPIRIVTIHSISHGRFCNNYDGPAEELATRMGRCNGYPVTASIGYPTPGSFGTWAGLEQNIATVTLELPSHHSPQRCWWDNHLALLASR